jgi:hypothetical protein
MQKPIGGLSAQKTRGVGPVLAQKTPNSMLRTTDAKAQKATENHQFAFHSFHRNTADSTQTTFKTLIPEDAILILSRRASKTIQQHRIGYQKRDATPHQQ